MTPSDVTGAERALTEVDRLRRRARARAHGGAWFPAATFAGLFLASIVLYRSPFASVNALDVDYPYWAGLPDEQRSATASYVFWFLGAPATFVLIGLWYRWRSRRTGMRVRWPLVVGTGIAVLILLAVVAAVPDDRTTAELAALTGDMPTIDWSGLLSPLVPIVAAVVVLGWVERSKGLIAAGLWAALLTWWQCTMGLGWGFIPGGNIELLQIHRPGPTLIAMASPLVAFAAVHILRARRAPA